MINYIEFSYTIVSDDDSNTTILQKAMKRFKTSCYGREKNGRDGLISIERKRPDVVLASLKDEDMVSWVRLAKKSWPTPPKIIVIDGDGRNTGEIVSMLTGGADSYSSNIDSLETAIKSTLDGGTWIDPCVASAVMGHLHSMRVEAADKPSLDRGKIPALTAREVETLQWIVDGKSNGEIADIFAISIGTVKTHARNIFQKMNVQDRTQAAVLALRMNLVR